MMRYRVAWLVLAFAGGCGGGGGGLEHDAGNSNVDGTGTAGQGGASGAAQSGASAGQGGAGGEGGAAGCVTIADSAMTTCVNGVVTTATNCASYVITHCPYGCKIAEGFGYGDDFYCNGSSDAGGQGGSVGGDGGGLGCVVSSDNDFTTCVNGVLTFISACPPSSSPAGTCPYGCRAPGQFGTLNYEQLCNSTPLDGGVCDGSCADASDGP